MFVAQITITYWTIMIWHIAAYWEKNRGGDSGTGVLKVSVGGQGNRAVEGGYRHWEVYGGSLNGRMGQELGWAFAAAGVAHAAGAE